MKKYILILLAVCMVLLTACGESSDIPSDAIITTDGDGFYYGIVQSGGVYYVRILAEYAEAPSDGDYLYVPLADDVYAAFQPSGVEGAWNPTEYNSLDELLSADTDDMITVGTKFCFGMTDGVAGYLAEYDYYADGGVNTANGEVNE